MLNPYAIVSLEMSSKTEAGKVEWGQTGRRQDGERRTEGWEEREESCRWVGRREVRGKGIVGSNTYSVDREW